MLYVFAVILSLGIGARFGYWLKEQEIEEGSLVEALVPESVEKSINELTGKEVFEADLDKGSNND